MAAMILLLCARDGKKARIDDSKTGEEKDDEVTPSSEKREAQGKLW